MFQTSFTKKPKILDARHVENFYINISDLISKIQCPKGAAAGRCGAHMHAKGKKENESEINENKLCILPRT